MKSFKELNKCVSDVSCQYFIKKSCVDMSNMFVSVHRTCLPSIFQLNYDTVKVRPFFGSVSSCFLSVLPINVYFYKIWDIIGII